MFHFLKVKQLEHTYWCNTPTLTHESCSIDCFEVNTDLSTVVLEFASENESLQKNQSDQIVFFKVCCCSEDMQIKVY